MTRRTEKVNELLRKEVSQLIAQGVKDPRLRGVVTVTEVHTSADLRHARVYLSVLGSAEEKQMTLKGVTSAAGFMRHELKGRLSLRRIPEFSFVLDESLEDAQRIYNMLDDLASQRQGSSEAAGPRGKGQGVL